MRDALERKVRNPSRWRPRETCSADVQSCTQTSVQPEPAPRLHCAKGQTASTRNDSPSLTFLRYHLLELPGTLPSLTNHVLFQREGLSLQMATRPTFNHGLAIRELPAKKPQI